MTLDPSLSDLDQELEHLMIRLDDPAMTPACRLAALELVDDALARGRTSIADARAKVIAEAVQSTSTRQVAVELALSPAAVAKAVARARALTV